MWTTATSSNSSLCFSRRPLLISLLSCLRAAQSYHYIRLKLQSCLAVAGFFHRWEETHKPDVIPVLVFITETKSLWIYDEREIPATLELSHLHARQSYGCESVFKCTGTFWSEKISTCSWANRQHGTFFFFFFFYLKWVIAVPGW